MPVTARLSKRFYEVLGEDVANELVEWFNNVDATYRADLRELNELNFARFDAKLEQRITELRSEMQAGFARFEGRFDGKLEQLRSDLVREIAKSHADLIRWMFVFCAGSALGAVGLLKIIVR